MNRVYTRLSSCIDLLVVFSLVLWIASFEAHEASNDLELPSETRKRPSFRERAALYKKYTSYAQVLGGTQDHMKMSFSTRDDFYFSDVIPKNIRENAVDGKECREYYVHYNYGDGFGHQLNDIAAAMVYHLLNRNQLCYLGLVYYDGDHGQFDHAAGCNSCTEIYNALSRQWPGIDHLVANRTIHKFESNKLWAGIAKAGGEKMYGIVPCPRCDKARMTVARLWVDVVKKIAAKRNIPTVDVAIHIRKGDFPRNVSDSYADVIDGLFRNVTLDVFTENPGEAHEVLAQLNSSHEIRLHEGGDAVENWLMMAKAKVLFLHESSYSISASIASEGIIFSQNQKPYQGRYDNHYFACKTTEGGWWVSTGHGNTTCDMEKIQSVSRALVEKYRSHERPYSRLRARTRYKKPLQNVITAYSSLAGYP